MWWILIMARLAKVVEKIRSKNAGPFWLTVDIFCGDGETYDHVRAVLKTEMVSDVFDTPTQMIKRFDMAELNVIKLSFPRPVVQGSQADRDMHGASFGALLGDLEIETH